MELTEEQLKKIVADAIEANNKILLTKQNADVLFAKKGDIPSVVDTSKFVTTDTLKTTVDSINENITGIVADVKKLITKVFPQQTEKQKSNWFVFD